MTSLSQIKLIAITLTSFFLVAAGTIVNGYQMYYMAATLLALPIVSYILGRTALRGLEVRRQTPGVGWAGEVLPFALHVRARTRVPRLFLQAHDCLPEFLDPASDEPPVFSVPASGEASVHYDVRLRKRGLFHIPYATVTAVDPLGLFRFSARVPAAADMLVYPRPEELPPFLLSGAERFGLMDNLSATTHGSGMDPDGVRRYVAGDPLRRMHWRTVARTGQLSVIEFEEASSISLVLVLDLHEGSDVGTGLDTTLEYLVRLAASLAQLATRQGASVRIVCGTNTTDTPGRGSEHLLKILAVLAQAEASDGELLSAVLVQRVGAVQPGTTLVVLTADADPALGAALAHYSSGHCAVAVVYADPDSFDPKATPARKQASRSRFAESVASAGARTLVIRKQDAHALVPETVDFFVKSGHN